MAQRYQGGDLLVLTIYTIIYRAILSKLLIFIGKKFDVVRGLSAVIII